jgi:hypothetical protein
MQFHIPSVAQAVPAAIAEPEPVVPVLAGVEADDTGVDATCVGAAALAGEETETGADVGRVPVEEVGIVTNTPPEGAELVPTDAGGDWVAAWVADGVLTALTEDPEPALAATAAPHADPVGVDRAEEVANPN